MSNQDQNERKPYCRVCKTEWGVPTNDRVGDVCPNCGHKITFLEDFETTNLGKIGVKGWAYIVPIIILILVLMKCCS